MIQRLIFICGFCFILSCAHTELALRNPTSAATQKLSQNLKDLEAVQLPSKEKEGAENPWKFVDGFYACDNKFASLQDQRFSALTLESLVRQDSPLVNDWIQAANARTYQHLSCDEKYRKIVTELFEGAKELRYSPRLTLNISGEVERASFSVNSYRSMAFKDGTSALVRSLVEIPRFNGPNVPNTIPSAFNTPQADEANELNFGNLKISSASAGGMFCENRIENLINHTFVDDFYSVCSNRTDILLAPVRLGGEAYVIYGDVSRPSQQSDPEHAFVFRLHKLTTEKSSLSAYDRYHQEQGNEKVILALTGKESYLAMVPEAPVPYGMVASVEESTGTLMMALNLLMNGSQQIRFYKFDSRNFSLKSMEVIHQSPDALLSLLSFKGHSLLFEKRSRDTNDQVLRYDTDSGETRVVTKSYSTAPVHHFNSRVLFYTSKDNLKLPMWITSRDDFKLNAPSNFGVATVYGGFNMVQSLAGNYLGSEYDAVYDRGGFVANVITRGGGEMGLGMRDEGYGTGTQKTADDFNAAVQFLYSNGFAGPRRIVSEGWSKGGLIVLMAGLQRPELFGGIIAGSPITNILDLSALEQGNSMPLQQGEYGLLTDPTTVEYWKSNQPVSLAKSVKNPPPILLRTAYGDPNVNPGHSLMMFKILNGRTDRKKFEMFVRPMGEGHGPQTDHARVEEYSYIFSFIFRNLNIE